MHYDEFNVYGLSRRIKTSFIIYSKTVKGLTRKDLQRGHRHSVRNYIWWRKKERRYI